MADISLIVDYTQVKQANEAILAVGTTAQKSASVFEKAFKKVEASQRKALSDVKQQMAASKRLGAQKLKEANMAEKATQALAKEEERLKNKFVEGYTAMNIYTKELNDLAVARKKDIITADQQAAAVEALNADMAAGTGAFRSYGGSIQQTRSRQSQLGVLFQQTGYQVGDFAVQVQSGQNAMVAFGQQATQLVGTFGMLSQSTKMIAMFAGLGIAIPILTAIGGAIMRTRGKTDKAAESTKGFEEAIKSAREEVKGMEGDLRLLQSGFENTFQLGLSDSIKVAEEKLKEARENLFNTISAQTGIAAGAGIDIGAFFRLSPEDAEAAIKAAEKELEAAKRTAWELQNIKDIREQTVMVIDSQAEATEAARAKAEDYLSLVSKLEQELGEAEVTALLLAGVDIEAGVDTATAAAAALMVNLGLAYDEAVKIVALGSTRPKARPSDIDFGVLEQTLSVYEDILGSAEGLVQATEAQNQLFGDLVGKADKFLEAVSSAEGDVEALSKINIASGINAAAIEASDLADSMKDALLDALGLVQLTKDAMSLSPFGGEGDEFYSSPRTVYPSWEEGSDRPGTKRGSAGGGGKSPQEQLDEYLQKKKEEADLQSQLVGLFGEERDLKSELIKFEQEYGKVALPRQAAEFEATIKQIAADKERQKVLEEAKAQQEALAQSIADSMGDAFMSIIDGTASVKDAFKSMAAAIIKELLQILVIESMVKSISGSIGSIFPSSLAPTSSIRPPSILQANGGAWQSGSQIKAYANGGVVGGPTYFPMSGGKTGLMGEAGPEAIMPLKRGANGKLGVQMEGNSGGDVNIVQNFSFQANGDDSVKKLISQAAPKIAQMTKNSMLDDRRRGGVMKNTFG